MSTFILVYSLGCGLLFVIAICKAARECAKPINFHSDLGAGHRNGSVTPGGTEAAPKQTIPRPTLLTAARGGRKAHPALLSPSPRLVSSLAPPRRGYTILRRLRPFAGLLK